MNATATGEFRSMRHFYLYGSGEANFPVDIATY
jgi:hypothetical protein